MDKNNKMKIDFKKQVLPILLIIAALIIGFLFKDELIAMLGSEGGYSDYTYTYETDETEESAPISPVTEEQSASADSSVPDTTTMADTSSVTVESEQPEEVEIQYYFRSQSQYEQHYEKHGHEFTPIFGEITMEEYLMYANALIQSEDEEILTKTEKEDGDFMYFRPSTEEFLVLSTDGYIRTYFIPTAGIDYWNRQ